jgi:hypothetical protein
MTNHFVPAHDPKAKKPAMARRAPRRDVAVLQWPPHSCGRAFGLQRGTTLGSCTQRCGARRSIQRRVRARQGDEAELEWMHGVVCTCYSVWVQSVADPSRYVLTSACL